ncbi:MAG: RNA polymerase sigma factor [Clostridiales bacterium]|nr:RNA polymerase sigma factor [Clostridiales bacterium]
MKKDERSRLFEFFATESDRLMRYVRAKVNRISDMDAEDIVREVMLSLILRADQGGPVENITAYAYRSVRNRIVDFQAERAKSISLDGFSDVDEAFSLREILSDETQDVVAKAERKELLRAVTACLDRMEPKQRAVLIATEFHGKSFRELSRAWHEPVGTLLSRKSRAVKTLRALLSDHFRETKLKEEKV